MFLPGIFLPLDSFHNVLAVEHTHESINLRHFGKKLGLVTLDQAARDDDALALAVRLHRDGFADRFK